MTATTTPGRRRTLRGRFGDLGPALIFILPASIGFVAFFLAPSLAGIWYSFTDYALFGPVNFIGIENYVKLVQDPLFWNALVVTVKYVVINIGVQTVLAVGIAVLMHRLTRSLVIRGIILLPYLVANVVVALLWFWIFDYSSGIVNQLLQAVGIHPLAFFGDEALAIPTIALVNVWRFAGYTALLIFAGLQTIPGEYYEAAALDGASEFRMFRSITLPLLRPVLALVLVISIVGSFQIFDTVAVTVQGGPVNSTRVIYYYIYELAFERYHFGYASAIAVVLLVILAGVSALQLRLLRASSSDLA
ncbi:MAG: sugar ABC transporter permease [Leifsonia xyli]|nr:MAG: sugar ABC transporter permease [Leifsonia xyli]